MKFIEEYKALEQYDELLDEIYGTVSIGGYTYDTSRTLKQIDPIAYRCGFLDWLDSENLTTDESEADETDEETE